MSTSPELPSPPQEAHEVTRVAIVGSMGVGKSTVATLVARRLSVPVVDSDSWIEEAVGTNARAFALREGVASLHRLEQRMLKDTIAGPGSFVLTPAASIVDDPECRDLLASMSLVVWLDPDPHLAHRRAIGGIHRRSITLDEYLTLHDRRRRWFAKVADLRLTGDEEPDELAEAVVARLTGRHRV